MFKMFSYIKSTVRLGPRGLIREYIKLPVIKFIHDTLDLYKNKTKTGINNVREILFRGTVVALATAIFVWLAIFMYIAFYFVYVPTVGHERPVHLKFRSCEKNPCGSRKSMCSFPSAHIQLTEKQRLLMLGQPYKIHLNLEMPESPANKDLGMFMVCADFHGTTGQLLANSCRAAMLHYRSFLLDAVYKFVFSPLFLFGSSEEKQNLHIELFSEYLEPQTEPVTDIFIEIQSIHVEIYSAKFFINAHFTGLRFLMYNWPVISAAIGITTNLFFVAIVCLMSWYQIINSEEYICYIGERGKNKSINDFDSEADSTESSFGDDVSLLGEENKSLLRDRRLHRRDYTEGRVEDIYNDVPTPT